MAKSAAYISGMEFTRAAESTVVRNRGQIGGARRGDGGYLEVALRLNVYGDLQENFHADLQECILDALHRFELKQASVFEQLAAILPPGDTHTGYDST